MKITDIISTLRKADEAYYNTSSSIMTDGEYDALRDELKSLDPNNEYFKNVGSKVPEHREEVKLMMHMGSQNKATNDQEMTDWFNKYQSPQVVVSDKLDGSSMEAYYLNGDLKSVATRGDGSVGMCITRNAILWSGLPHKINANGKVLVRGEAQISHSTWKQHFSDSANPRNCANGIVVCDFGYDRNKYVVFHAFDIINENEEYKLISDKLENLKELGFNVVNYCVIDEFNELSKIRERYVLERNNLEFGIDGMIVAINNIEKYESLGYSDGGTRPRGSVAWKFDTERAETKVDDITLTIGHTGAIIPTAVLEPVYISGTTVSNCLLNNFEYIADLNLNVGDIVEIEKAGDIIPHVTKVVMKNSDGCYQPPNEWKGYPVIQDGRVWKVVDEDCPDLSFQRIRNWVNKTNIKQLGDNTLLAMVECGMIKDIDDLYNLDKNELSKLQIGNGVVGSNATKIIAEIDKTRNITIDMFIGSMSIKFLGRSRAKLLIDYGFDNVEFYINSNPKSFEGLNCSDTGTYSLEVSNEIWSSIQKRKDILTKMSKIININSQQKIVNSDSAISGKSFCFSGIRIKGDQKYKFEDLGGIEKSGVSAGLNYLVLKDVNSTSKKATKARSLGTKIISFEDFERMLDD